jgi:hypothetical protein
MRSSSLAGVSLYALTALLFAASPVFAAGKAPPPAPLAPPSPAAPLAPPPPNNTLDVKDPTGNWQMMSMPMGGSLFQCSASRNNAMPVMPLATPAAPGAAPPLATPPVMPPTVSLRRTRSSINGTPTDTLQIQISSFAPPEKSDYGVTVDDSKLEAQVTSRSYNRNVDSSVDLKTFSAAVHKGKKVTVALDGNKLELQAGVVDSVLGKLNACVDAQEKAYQETIAQQEAAAAKAAAKK